MRQKTLPRIDL